MSYFHQFLLLLRKWGRPCFFTHACLFTEGKRCNETITYELMPYIEPILPHLSSNRHGTLQIPDLGSFQTCSFEGLHSPSYLQTPVLGSIEITGTGISVLFGALKDLVPDLRFGVIHVL